MKKQELSLQEIQKVSLEILKNVADVCEKLNLRYFLAYGTLLGAVRHEDYIPWDDDVDIWMPRPDYDALMSYFHDHADELLPLQIMNDDTAENYPYMITRVSDSRYELDVINEKNYGIGIFIDIYPLDGLGNDKKVASRMIDKGKALSSMVFLSTRKYLHKGNTSGILKMICKVPAFIFAKITGKAFFAKRSLRQSGLYAYDRSQYVGCVVWPTYRERDIYEKRLFDDSVMLNFGKYQFRAPKDYDYILTQIYHDYMQLPPESKRVAHHLYSAYEKQ